MSSAQNEHHQLFPCAHSTDTVNCLFPCAHSRHRQLFPYVHSMTLHISPQWSSLSVQLHPLYRTKSLLYLWSLDVVSIFSVFLHSITIFFFLLNLISTTRVQSKKHKALTLLLCTHKTPAARAFSVRQCMDQKEFRITALKG